jgi:PAS domain S-box-containing protein
MKFLGIYNLISIGLTAIIGFSLALLSLVMESKREINRYFSWFVGSVAMWALFSLILLLELTIRTIDPQLQAFGAPELYLEFSVITLALMMPLLLMFVSRYIRYNPQWLSILIYLNLLILVIIAWPVFNHEFIRNPRLHANGLTVVDFSPLAVVLVIWSLLMMLLAVYLLWKSYHQAEERWFIWGIGIFLIGFGVRMVPNLPAPIMSTSSLISMLILGYPLLRRQMLHPLREKTALLENEIAERRRMEQLLAEREERYRILAENIPLGLILHHHGVILWTNRYAAGLLEPDDKKPAKERSIYDIFHSESHPMVLQQISEAKKTMKALPYSDHKLQLANGVTMDIKATMVPIHQGDEVQLLSIFLDLTEIKTAKEMLTIEQERLLITLRSIGDGVIATDTTGRITLMNRIAEELTGWQHQEAVGEPLQEVFVIIDSETELPRENPVNAVKAQNGIVLLDDNTVLISRDGKRRIIADSAAPILDGNGAFSGCVLVFRDVTTEKSRDEAMNKIQKLESIGILAGGIAHDFNNILTAILGNISMATVMTDKNPHLHQILRGAERAALRARDLTAQLLTFSKGGAPVIRATSVTDIIKESADFVAHGSNCAIDYHFDKNIWPVSADAGQIGQVIQNLTLNAIQAMSKGGTIRINAINDFVIEQSGLPLRPGKYVRIEVQDQGSGIPLKNLKTVFEPYFSTKEKGHGLGLAMVFSIIRKHNGWITVQSEMNKGTKFILFIPAAESTVPLIQLKTDKKPAKGAKILVMDDEESILDVTRRILEIDGHQVLLARSGDEAVAIYEEESAKGKAPDLVITDLTVPGGMGGKETLETLLSINPKIKVIVSSGYTNDPVMADYQKYGFKDIITKPYQFPELRAAIARTLERND